MLEPAQPHLLQLDPHHHFDRAGLERGVFQQRQRDILAHGQRADQRAALKCQADFLADGIHLARASRW